VPQSDVPGEKTAATQPHPPDKLQYRRRNYLKVPEDLIDFTPELRAKAMEVLKRYRVIPSAFSPPVLGDCQRPSRHDHQRHATNWPGGAYDPETQTAFMPAGNTVGAAHAGGAAR